MGGLTRLDKLLLSVVLLAIVAAGGVFTWRHIQAGSSRPYQIGGHFDFQLPGLSETGVTLLIWISTDCRYCEASMPFYARLAAQPHRARIVLVGSEDREVLQRYGEKFRLNTDDVVSTNGKLLRCPGTPSLLLLDKDRIIRATWYGQLMTTSREMEVFRSLAAR